MDVKRTKSGIGYAVALLVVGLAFDAMADVTLTKGSEKSRGTYPRGLSGLTYLGGNKYYSVCDNGVEIGLYPCTIALAADGLSVSSFSTVATNVAVKLPGTSDLEACAYDPATGNIWVADESGATIKEYTTNGVAVQTLSYPAILKNKRHDSNRGFEALTISGDGLTMWTCTEEALTIDGDISAQGSGTLVRLAKFARATVNDTFQLVAMYPYLTDGWHNPYGLEADGAAHGSGSGRRGVAALTALPDGSLLVLERECSSDTAGNGIWAKIGAEFYYSIYRVSDFTSATDVKGSEYDIGLASVPAVRVAKTRVIADFTCPLANYEGMCLGPRLSNGKATILMVTDSGDGNTNSSVWPFVLDGLNIHTLNFEEPAGYTASIKGCNYRYQNGAQISVELSGPGVINSAYTNNGEAVATALWSVANQSPASGSGYTAAFTVGGDGTLTWAVETSAAVSPVIANDSFQAYAVGTLGSDISGWTGDEAEVVAANYSLAAGYPMDREAHTKVLSVDGDVTRTYPAFPQDASNSYQKLDFAMAVRRAPSNEEMDGSVGDNKLVIACDKDGHICICCRTAEGTNWVQLSNTVYANDDWARVELTFDESENGAFAQVKIDGAECTTGCVSPTDSTVGGSWYRLLTESARVSSLVASGICKLDDVILTVEPKSAATEVTFADDGATSLLESATAAKAAIIATYINGLTDATVVKPVTVVTKPMVVSYLLGANKVLSTTENELLKITAIEQVDDDWQITVAVTLNAADTTAGASVDLNNINGTLKVVATDDLAKSFSPVDSTDFTVTPAGSGSPDVIITVTDANARFLKATITE